MTEPYADLGRRLPSRFDVHAQARELLVMAGRALDFAGTGRSADLPRALAELDRMRAVLGEGDRHG